MDRVTQVAPGQAWVGRGPVSPTMIFTDLIDEIWKSHR
jgi:hypothetical protein